MERNLFNVLLKCSKTGYDKKKVSQIIYLIKHAKTQRKIDSLKFELFKKSSVLLLKAINNFKKLTENIPNDKVLHSEEDIASECWIIFNRCIDALKIEDCKKYNFYLNTSLNRGIYRVYERNYKKHFDVISNSESNELSIMFKKINSDIDLIDLDLQNNFSNIEIEIINFKISGEKLSVFLKNNNMSNNQYSVYLDKIKAKLIELYKKEENYE